MTTVAILARNSAGTPLAGLTPTWVVYFNGVTGAAGTQPAIAAIGAGGSYGFTSEPAETNPAACGIIDFGGVAVPRYAVYSAVSSVFVFPAWNEFGEPLAGLTPTWASLVLCSDGTAYAQPAITALGGGLYKTTMIDDHVTGTIDLGATGYGPRYVHYDSEAITGAGGAGSPPIISNIAPIDGEIDPGEPGAFSATFRTARLTPITFDLSEIGLGADVAISVKFGSYNETFVARDMEGEWVWPFDLEANNIMSAIVLGNASVSMLPRGGWPPGVVEFKVGAAVMAVQS